MITEKYKGVEIVYSEESNHWEFIYDGGERVAPSLALAKKRIDAKPKFKRIDCWCTGRYCGDAFRQGELTSLTDDKCAWVTIKGEGREKLYSRNVYPRNQFNDLLVGRIGALRKEIAALEKQVEAEVKKLQGLPAVKKEEA